ncbi:MAG TPA: cytochrome D1 domain-containing protein [Pyrinomonadaceae bacterium]|jgi:YVTN family beta-propeller protein|nr:cytochrome D1 domain-containing protein [Pyrinomonadaceae bacterium]
MKTIRPTLLKSALLCGALALGLLAPANAQEKAGSPQSQPAPAAAATKPAAVAPGTPQKVTAQGVEVEFTINPVAPADDKKTPALLEEQDALVRFRITDTATRTPLAGAKPSVWISRGGTGAADPKVCHEKIQSFLQGSLRARPDVDLNAYYLLALNQEPNISVIDPLLGFGGSKLITLVFLKSPGEDWAITADQERLFVTMPAINKVAVVDTNTWQVVANIDTGAKPVRVALQPDGKYVWVGTDAGAESGVTVIDASTLKVAARIQTGAGHHEIALRDDNKLAFVTNRDAGTLSVIDVQKLAKVTDLKAGASAASLAYSTLSQAVYVTDEAGGQITVFDARAPKVLTSVAVKPGVRAVRIAPGGRYGFAANPAANAVYVFDAATNRLLHTVQIDKHPDQITFTQQFAYVRASGSADVTMINLNTVGVAPNLVSFPGGQVAPDAGRTRPSVADSVVPSPEGGSVLVANVADGQIYYYSEGMAAPMGNFQNYKRDPRAVLIADRSLREARTGTYETVVRLPKAGPYDVAFLLDAPRITNCFSAEAAFNPAVAHEREIPLRVEYLDRGKPLRVGGDNKLRFRLTDPATGKPKDGLTDVNVMMYLAPGLWQKRAFAQSVGAGVYELKIDVPQAGTYVFSVGSRSQGVDFRQLPNLMLEATEATATTAAPAAKN